MSNGLTPWITAAISLVLTAAVVWLGTPRPPLLTDHSAGDRALAAQLRALTTNRGHQSIAAAVITPDAITHAAIGEAIPRGKSPIGPDDPIELGSITKTFNGFLLAHAVDRGEANLDDPVSRHLPELVDAPLGNVTLLELATHRGGVPPLPQSLIGRVLLFQFTGANPYADATRDATLAEVGTLPAMGKRGEVQYSNLGATLLGWALANAAGFPDWESFVDERLLSPMGINAAFAAQPDMIPVGTVAGYTGNGFRPETWTSPPSDRPGPRRSSPPTPWPNMRRRSSEPMCRECRLWSPSSARAAMSGSAWPGSPEPWPMADSSPGTTAARQVSEPCS